MQYFNFQKQKFTLKSCLQAGNYDFTFQLLSVSGFYHPVFCRAGFLLFLAESFRRLFAGVVLIAELFQKKSSKA